MMRPGFSLMDWNNLARVADLAQGQHSASRQLTLEEVRKHKTWCCIRGKVYDFAQYIPYHPGGADELERGAGDDCTALFEEFHPWVNVETMFKRCQVGVLVASPATIWTSAKVESVEDLGGHFFRVRFSFNKEDDLFRKQLQDARDNQTIFHVKIRTKMGPNQRFIERPYTPLIDTDDQVTILIKRSVKKNRICLSHAICTESALNSKFDIQLKPCMISMEWYNLSKRIGMVCAGSGITPALQLISREADKGDKSDKQLYLVWCNRDEMHASLRPRLAE